MQFGSLIHLFFEQIEWLDQHVPDNDALMKVARQNDVDEEHVRQALLSFRRMIAQPEVSTLLSSAGYADQLQADSARRLEVRCEQPLVVSLGDKILSGAIDRLVVTLDKKGRPVAADVIDFKTDAIKDQLALLQRVEYYRPQLQAYAEGVQRMLRLSPEQVSARLLFLAHDHVATIC